MNQLQLVRSDAGDGGWSLHQKGFSDEQFAAGAAPVLLSGTAEFNKEARKWSRPNTKDYAAAKIKAAADLWDLHNALIAFEMALENETDEDGDPVYFNHRDFDTESTLKYYGIDICELPTFGGENVSSEGVWSWDEDHVLAGEGPFKDWEIRERN